MYEEYYHAAISKYYNALPKIVFVHYIAEFMEIRFSKKKIAEQLLAKLNEPLSFLIPALIGDEILNNKLISKIGISLPEIVKTTIENIRTVVDRVENWKRVQKAKHLAKLLNKYSNDKSMVNIIGRTIYCLNKSVYTHWKIINKRFPKGVPLGLSLEEYENIYINKKIFKDSLINKKISGVKVLEIAENICKQSKIEKWIFDNFLWNYKKLFYIKNCLTNL